MKLKRQSIGTYFASSPFFLWIRKYHVKAPQTKTHAQTIPTIAPTDNLFPLESSLELNQPKNKI